MNLATKLLSPLLMSAVALSIAPIAQASNGDGFAPNEVAYLDDLTTQGMGPAVSAQGLVAEGWTICHALAADMSPVAAADKVFAGSATASTNGITRAQAQGVVTTAIDNLCPQTP
ncbi:DUF732 domain-containing protein [Mycolicibacterium komossense]|uniref:DUF732 domain-containing protein n=1 Tax=Mycolicibacterium komossense TaxID=1779 RepID=A0ABT3CJZ9_9MYCO|nr:DUF732 domain-containing protein [Mycolicibacterium komossense]MCV7229561.1 DUF732 domain-containing protein [Mycolicibacterium komossense]